MDVSDSKLTSPAKAQADQGEKGFSKIEVLLEATGGLSLSQVCVVTGLEASTIQNWVKRGWVAHPIGKRYEEVHIARILIINALKECIKLEHIAMLMTFVNGRAKDGSEAIIKESILYNYLCDAMKMSGQAGDGSKGGVESVVETVLKDYKSPSAEARNRLRKALTLMMYACVCTDVKRRTEAMMGQIIKELDESLTVAPARKTTKTAAAPPPVAAPVSAPSPVQPVPAATTPVTPQAPAAPPSAIPIPAAAPVTPKTTIPPQAVTPIKITLDDPAQPDEEYDEAAETRKTISQALREWDISSVEKIIIDHDDEARSNAEAESGAASEAKKPVNRPWYIRKNK